METLNPQPSLIAGARSSVDEAHYLCVSRPLMWMSAPVFREREERGLALGWFGQPLGQSLVDVARLACEWQSPQGESRSIAGGLQAVWRLQRRQTAVPLRSSRVRDGKMRAFDGGLSGACALVGWRQCPA